MKDTALAKQHDGQPSDDDGDRPVLSVVIPCRNAADTLPTQLEALAGQRSPVPWEVIVCDNGSTDSSRSIAAGYASRLPRLTIADAADCRGAGAVRNHGVERARGAWVAFCDADDEVAPTWVESMARALSTCRVVAGAFEGSRLNDPRTLRYRDVPQAASLQRGDFGAWLPHAGAGNLGIHRDVFRALGGFDPHLRWLEDADFCWRAQMSGEVLTFVPDAVVHVRLRSTLRSSIRQGWEYGRAHMALEERYAATRQQAAADGSIAEPPATTPRLSVGDVVQEPRRSAWRIGHALGRRAQRWDRSAPVVIGPPRLASMSKAAPVPGQERATQPSRAGDLTCLGTG